MADFALVESTIGQTNQIDIQWYEMMEIDGRTRLYNEYGGYHYLSSDDKINLIIETEDWITLLTKDRVKLTSAYKKLLEESSNSNLKTGWLDINGKMHYCHSTCHISYAEIILDSTPDKLQKTGWLHIYEYDNRIYYSSYNNNRITYNQAIFLRDNGLDISDEDILY